MPYRQINGHVTVYFKTPAEKIFQPRMLEEFTEGTAKIIKEENTFFNPAQKLNRDISTEVIKAYFKEDREIRILTAMSATGLRGIRYLNEIKNSVLFFNDICPNAVETIKSNLAYNNIEDARVFGDNESIREYKGRVNLTRADCHVLMHRFHSFFDVIDIDPFGSCAEFVDSAFKAIKHNGLICFTCTDKAALCSNESKCYMKYNTHIKKVFCKNETPIRTLLSYISRSFAKYDAKIIPIISLSVDFYVRVIVQVYKGKGKGVITDNSYYGICECENRIEFPFKGSGEMECMECMKRMRLYGPFWNKEIHSKEIIDRILGSVNEKGNERMVGILRLMSQELPVGFYYETPKLASVLKINCWKLVDVMTGLANAGYKVSLTHSDNNSFKTDAPLWVIKELLYEMSRKTQVKYSLNKNTTVEEIFRQNFYKGKLSSGLKPLSLPKKE